MSSTRNPDGMYPLANFSPAPAEVSGKRKRKSAKHPDGSEIQVNELSSKKRKKTN
jgi:hypothetical protein